MAQHHSLIDTETLDTLLFEGRENLVLLYTSMNSGPASKPDIVKKAPSVRIPESQFFDFQNIIVDKSSSLSHMMPSHDVFEREVRKLGVNENSKVVIYDDFGNFCASRVWFMFKVCGHDNVMVLDGGLPLWLDENRQTSNQLSTVTKLGNFKAKISQQYQFVDREFVKANIINPTCPLYDARSPARFKGQERESRCGLRSGHIPLSKNVHYARLFDKKGRFLNASELKTFFETSEVGIVFSCGSGITACLLAQAADICGFQPLLVYDGSWSDWGADPSLPIEVE